MAMSDEGDRIIVRLDRGEQRIEELSVARVVNCTGPALDLRSTGEPLLDSLFGEGAVRPGPLRLGLDHDSRGALIGTGDQPSGVLYGIGPVRKGRLWETTAIREIRTQALELADHLTSEIGRASAGRGEDLALAS